MFDFDLSTETLDEETCVIVLRGEVDLFTAHDLRRAGSEALDAGARRIVVDLTEVSFLDSTGLGALIGIAKRVRPAGGEVAIVNVDETITGTFSITGVDEMIAVRPTRDEAVVAVREGAPSARRRSVDLSGAR